MNIITWSCAKQFNYNIKLLRVLQDHEYIVVNIIKTGETEFRLELEKYDENRNTDVMVIQ